jgi:uncharacterized membrane protein
VTILLSLLTALFFGTGDFCGGLSAKRATVLQVVAGSHAVGLLGVTVAAFLLADEFSVRAMLLGATGGVFGGIGVAFLYRRLAVGPMAVVAPITAITSAAVPALWGTLRGDALSALARMGVLVALVAIGLVSSSTDGAPGRISPRVIGESLLAGVGFGMFFIFLDATEAVDAPWPVVGARLVTVVGIFTFMMASSRRLVPPARSAIGLIVLTGVFDTGSNVTFLYATNSGALTIVAVLSSLYPIATVLLARAVLLERMTRTQLTGFASALVATVLIAAG